MRVDPRLTSAALAHLLENAAQYSPRGSTITITHELTAEGLGLSVHDQGAGIVDAAAARTCSSGSIEGRKRTGTFPEPGWASQSCRGCWPRWAGACGRRMPGRRRAILDGRAG